MKPLVLTMQAFGPYAGREVIDFKQLENRTMFVISGKTGAGKTTIFDGISFAIYGKASGEDRNGQELRSQFAEDDLGTEISLEFELRGKTYFIVRAPQQERKKKSGEGHTVVGAKAELYKLTDSGKVLLGANIREVDEQIKHIMGIDANQFRQIIMIPQGEFRKLLTSDSKDKELILQKLFHTELYKRIEEKLKEDAAELRKLSERSRQTRIHLIKEIQSLEDSILTEEIMAEEPNEQRILPLLIEEINKANESLDVYTAKIKKEQIARDKIQGEIYQAQELLKRFEELEKLRLEKDELVKRKPEMETKAAVIKMAQRAGALEKQEQFYLRMGRQAKDLQTQLDQQNETAKKLFENTVLLQKRYDAEMDRTSDREQLSAKVHHLQQLKLMVDTFSEQKQTADDLNGVWKQTQTEQVRLEKQLSQMEIDEEKIALLKTEAEQAVVLFAELERQADKNDDLLTKLVKLEESDQFVKQAHEEFYEKKEVAKQAVERAHQQKTALELLESKWRESQAGILAAALTHGEMCPVCGSYEHPAKAVQSAEQPDEDELKQQKAEVNKAEQQKTSAETAFYKAESRYQSLHETFQERFSAVRALVDDFELTRLEEYKNNCQLKKHEDEKQLQVLLKKKQTISSVSEKISSIKTEKRTIKSEIETMKLKEEKARTQLLEANAKLAATVASIPEEIREPKAFNQALKQAVTEQKRLEEALEAARTSLMKGKEQETAIKANITSSEDQLKKVTIELNEERSRFKVEMTALGFESYGSYVAAKKTEAELKTLESDLQQYEQRYQTVTNVFHDLELKLKGAVKPDIEALQQQFRNADHVLEELRQLFAKLTSAKQKNEQIHEKLDRMILEQKEIEDRYRVIGHLHEVSKGQNPFRITFERFVLASFLDEILNEANIRLNKMTSGRFQLMRKIDPTRRNIQSGLELTVYDQYTGQERHVKTLSGGESFKASLALALGLADVVQQHAGGISLETMFVDEGFGTLDPESLDQALEALMDIQNSGRLVGIISHVPELKERIEARLEVIATQLGSRTEFQFIS
ncbi:SMC family ATPase [Peribacillus psychrosaccharolyticus]|uniref:Nuclease SbcCD subunit C n=1 Tax=Peribacillus psychrosaccharolyticus TaxID=1407 RepID=A0A974NPB0_PERPY|nr:SMC family ATPase [Peribacillus psychrosaccharolyticus]MEC2053982.1 SMC family ATPase [Peribacillus psychrosaccharolyticus]MED3742403.1 SMC family ATPase [Peribacillus psychrosaccharolyticus]QQT01366.1 SMC family ATPase [Peribacillus psychrosaccharolyticus]